MILITHQTNCSLYIILICTIISSSQQQKAAIYWYQKNHAKCVHMSGWCWRYFLILRVLFNMSFCHKAGQSIRSNIWKLCNVFVRQSGKKDLIRGGRIDGCSNMTTRPHIHRFLSVTSWANTRRLSFHSLRTLQISHSWLCSVSKAQINAERPPFSVYWGNQDKFASAFAQHS